MATATALTGRLLWADGVSEVAPDEILKLLARGVPAAKIATTELTPELVEFNQLTNTPILQKTQLLDSFPPRWIIPDKYAQLDLAEHLIGLAEQIKRDKLYERRLQRLAEEISLYMKLGYQDLLRALIYVINELNKHQVVWGVGRGSSCSSYLLFLLGLHEVDPVLYDIPITDFLRDS